MLPMKILFRSASALCLAVLLSGCVIAPAWGPYYHPHHYYGY
jgi:PBP1b-binding outer membrane lipoprotein LpoB